MKKDEQERKNFALPELVKPGLVALYANPPAKISDDL